MANFLGLIDMLDGGGKGQSGDTFEGGMFSGLLNSLGIRPMGYAGRQGEAQPQQAAAAPTAQATSSRAAPVIAPPPPPPAPVDVTTPGLSYGLGQAAIPAGMGRQIPQIPLAFGDPAQPAFPSSAELRAAQKAAKDAEAAAWLEFAMANPTTPAQLPGRTGTDELSAAWQKAMIPQPKKRSAHPMAWAGF